MKKRNLRIRTTVNRAEHESVSDWAKAHCPARYPLSAVLRLNHQMVVDAGLKPTKQQIKDADAGKGKSDDST